MEASRKHVLKKDVAMNNRIFIKKLIFAVIECKDLKTITNIEGSLKYCRVFTGISPDVYFATISKTGGHSVHISESTYRTWSSVLDAICMAKARIDHEL